MSPVIIAQNNSIKLDQDGNILETGPGINSAHYLPDERIISGARDPLTFASSYDVFDPSLSQLISIANNGELDAEGIENSEVLIGKNSAFLFLRFSDTLRKYDAQTYQIIKEINLEAGQLNLAYSELTIDDNYLFLQQNNPARIVLYDYNLEQVKSIQLSNVNLTKFDALNANSDSIIYSIQVLTQGKLLANASIDGVFQPFLLDTATETLTFPDTFGDPGTPHQPGRALATNFRSRSSIHTTPIPFNLAVLNKTETDVEIAWEHDANANIAGFDVYVDGVKNNAALIPTGTEISYTITGLNGGTTYQINIIAVNSQGVESNFSSTLNATTDVAQFGDGFETYAVATLPPGFSEPAVPDDAIWEVTDLRSFNGNQSLGSQDIADGQIASVEYTKQLDVESTLRFMYLASTEDGYDYFKFYIDGIEEYSDSGQTEWRLFEKILPAGTYTLRFEVIKDSSVGELDDAAYIDEFGFEAT